MTTPIQIDGSLGEGGGQVLRTSLTLSVLTGRPLQLNNIRANRPKPGLMRQHLTAVKAMAALAQGKLSGATLGSTQLSFWPGEVRAGDYHFSIGTAGSTTLVFQTILFALAQADHISTITLEGGTHNGKSPSLDFIMDSYLPCLKAMGFQCEIIPERLGFYPAGGGKWSVKVHPITQWKPLTLTQIPKAESFSLKGLVSRLPRSILEREVATVKNLLGWEKANCELLCLHTQGPGNALILKGQSSSHTSIIEVVGERRLRAEAVAQQAVGRMKKFLAAQAAVEEHLADQLLLPLALAKGGAFTTTSPSLHTQTNMKVIQQILGTSFSCESIGEKLWRIAIK